ncbi:hypothetical protein NVP1124O_57 [Vibrio phage 1.124.O._10N.286.49.B1]|nr:hypothetical protein NVP1124O_57 [Vibrio phage 1.124.O._10N.286.49.B1]
MINPMEYWTNMPRFNQEKQREFKKINCIFPDGSRLFARFDNQNDFDMFCMKAPISADGKNYKFESRSHLAICADQQITDKTKSIWFPYKSHWGGIKFKYIGNPEINNRYPVYIVSKGRAHNGLTWKALDKMRVKYYLVCEEQELDEYKESVNAKEFLVLPQSYLDEYDTCDQLGESRSKGPGAARNFCIDHSRSLGFKRHWVMDDNLDAFHYLTDNEKLEVETSNTISACEDFVDRYSNIPVAGMNYYSFCKKTDDVPPLKFNTRIYSCLLIDNESGYRWRGRYNEDTDLSLRVLKDGFCTVQFNAFLCGKVTTQRMRGGNSKEFYDDEGTMPKSKMLEDLHPDVSKVAWRFNRWHHIVNYKPFESNKPIRCEEDKIIDYHMTKVNK